MLRQMIGRGFASPPPMVNGSTISRTRIRGLSWQNALRSDKFKGLPSLFSSQTLLSSMQQMRSHSAKQPQEKLEAVKKQNNNENGHEHSVTSAKDELHTHSHSILGHSHTHGGDEHGHGHDAEKILAALKGSGV